jgi:D-alanine-D-alanine ligase-like ATP-grasp enzyme
MRTRVAIVYNEPQPSHYDAAREEKAVLGVLDEVNAVHQSLLELGHDVRVLPLLPPFKKARKKLAALEVDAVFNLFEGFCGEPETEALVPEALAELGMPFTGCGADIIRLALDKAGVKVLLKAAGIPTPDFQLLNPETLPTFRLGFPCIVKPRGEDASHGINANSVVSDYISLEKQVRAEIEEKEREHIAGTALAALRLLGGTGYARVDLRMDETGRLNVIEVNPNPDISPGTGAARQAAAAGMTYTGFIDKILKLALEKKKHGRQDTTDVRRGQTGVAENTAEYARI